MPTVRSIITDALTEIGVLAAGETAPGSDMELGLRRFQHQLDAWQADALTLAIQKRVTFTLTGGTSTVTIGPAGGDVTAVRPVYMDGINYIIPGSSPAVEVPIGPMDRDTYLSLSIKELQSQLPLASFYQTSTDTVLGSIFFWPQVTQDAGIVLYYPAGVGVPAAFDDVLLGPPGYQDAYLYQLAERLLTPFAIGDPSVIQSVKQHAADAFAVMKRPNTQPGQMGIDAALVPSLGGAYNVLSDTYTGSSGSR